MGRSGNNAVTSDARTDEKNPFNLPFDIDKTVELCCRICEPALTLSPVYTKVK